MTLQKLIELKPGAAFTYQGIPAKVVWTEFFREELGVFENEMKYASHFGMYFTFANTGITIRSCWPKPATLDLPDFQ